LVARAPARCLPPRLHARPQARAVAAERDDPLAALLARAVSRRTLMRQPGGATGAATTTVPAPPRTDDYGDGSPTLADVVGADEYGRGSPSMSDLIARGAITLPPPITENARRIKVAADGGLPAYPLFLREAEFGPPEPGHTRVPGGISLWGGLEVLTDAVFATVDAVVRDGEIRNVDLADPHAAVTVQMVLENVIWRGRDVIRWRTLGCVEEDDEGPAWVVPAPAAAVVQFLGLLPESVCRERAGRMYHDRPDLAPSGVTQLEVDDEGHVSLFGLPRRTGALPPPDRALSSRRAHHVATRMLTQLTLGGMWTFTGSRPRANLGLADDPIFEPPLRRPLTGRPEPGAEYPETPSYLGRGIGNDKLTMRITQVIAARLDDVVDWKSFGALIDGKWHAPAPPEWIASMLLIGPRAREAYALQRGRRALGPGRGGRERGNFPLEPNGS
jgi:hypothetical protein